MMVVEDDFIIAMELESVLADAGAEIVGLCRTVEDALDYADEEGLAAAVLDVRMGRDTSAPVARRLMERGIPFIFYTGQVDTEFIRAEWPACRILSKPAAPEMIVAAVAHLLEH
ncbi:MAG: response regulator [Methylobacteriaceae bacterium]|nr:response regulator [Methylobacteriaceae bacterium]